MPNSCNKFHELITRIWKAKKTSNIFFFLPVSVTPQTDPRHDLIITYSLTHAMRFEKFKLLMRGAICFLFMLGKEYKIRHLNSSHMQIEDETGVVIDFEKGEELLAA